jgi:hypothetical protein
MHTWVYQRDQGLSFMSSGSIGPKIVEVLSFLCLLLKMQSSPFQNYIPI